MLFTICLGAINVSLDSSILVVCYPALAAIFHTDSSVIGWVNVAYLMISQSLGVALARVGDGKGRKMVYMVGLAFYGFGMLACTFSQTPVQLILGRAVQGVGAATGWSLTSAMVAAVFPSSERGKALGMLAGVYSVGLVAGPLLGGLILDLLGWRAVFYTRIPLVMAAFMMCWAVIEEQREDGKFRFDVIGSLNLLVCLCSFMFFLNLGGRLGFGARSVLAVGGFTAFFFVLFLIAQARAVQPIVDLSLFKERLFSAAILSAALQNAASATAIFTMPFYLSGALGYSGSAVGVFLALLAVPLILVSPISGRLSDRIGSTFLSAFGMSVILIALLMLRNLGSNPSCFQTAIAVVCMGLGMSIFQSPNNSALMGAVPPHRLGTAAGILSTVRNIGSSSAIAVASSVYSARDVYHVRQLSAAFPDLTMVKRIASAMSYQDTLLIGIVITIIGALTTLVRGSAKKNCYKQQ